MRIKAYKIPLHSRRGEVRGYALVSPEDFDRVTDRPWHLRPDGYAGGRVNGKTVLLQWLVAGKPGDGRQVDHVNRNRLDNRRENLRFVTVTENRQNQSLRGGTSKYRGVHWHKPSGLWMARCKVNKQAHLIGYFKDEDEAGEAAREFRLAHLPGATD